MIADNPAPRLPQNIYYYGATFLSDRFLKIFHFKVRNSPITDNPPFASHSNVNFEISRLATRIEGIKQQKLIIYL